MGGWWWLAAAALLGLIELAAPGLYLVFFAAAAALTGVLVLLAPDAPLILQAASFAVSSIAAVALGRRVYVNRTGPAADPLLNDRAERLVGAIVTVEVPLVAGEGRVRVGDGAWPAAGPDLPAGANARVIGHEGGRLVVEPV